MGHEEPLTFFASPLHEGGHDTHGHGHGHGHGPEEIPMAHHSSQGSSDIERQKHSESSAVPFNSNDDGLHENPAFHRHAEATTAELFYDLFFVANLTTFTSLQEINDHNSLTAYIGFFCLLWLTWYQVSLYDVRFSTDSVFERCAKAIHFGTMVGFAVIGPQWKPGQEIDSYRIYKAFSLILMVSRFTLFLQYTVTFLYTKKYTKTRIPLLLIMGSSFVAAVIYGCLFRSFPELQPGESAKSNAYIAWYIVGILETILTVSVSCIWRVISFKGTHMVQRMSLLTLIILGEGIIVICKSISKIVKNEFLWTAAVVGQIVSAILIIYFLYMLYFDRMSEEHFGSIKQQIWSFLHFPLHTVLVLVLQGVSLLVIWCQAIEAFIGMDLQFMSVIDNAANYANGTAFSAELGSVANDNVFYYIPKGVDASAAIDEANTALVSIAEAFDFIASDPNNSTAQDELNNGLQDLLSATSKTLFDSLSISLPKTKSKTKPDLADLLNTYTKVFELVFVYVFVAAGLSLILTTTLGFLSLSSHQRRPSEYLRLAVNFVSGLGLCLVSLLKFNENLQQNYMSSPWMIPTLCIVLFICVVVNHIRFGKKGKMH